MKAVLTHQDNEVYVVFERRLENPWQYLAQIAQDIPELNDKPIRFSKRIPENTAQYVCWEMNGNGSSVTKTTDIKEAVAFLKPKKPLRTLGDLLKKYAAAK